METIKLNRTVLLSDLYFMVMHFGVCLFLVGCGGTLRKGIPGRASLTIAEQCTLVKIRVRKAPPPVLRSLERTFAFLHVELINARSKELPRWRLAIDESDNVARDGIFEPAAGKDKPGAFVAVPGAFCDGVSDEVVECLPCGLTDGCVMFLQIEQTSWTGQAAELNVQIEPNDTKNGFLCVDGLNSDDCKGVTHWLKAEALAQTAKDCKPSGR